MVRKLNETDREGLLNFLKEESAFNLFIIGDVLNTGFDKDFMDLWGEFDENNNLISVLLRYYNNFIPYYKNSYDGNLNLYKKIICSYNEKKLISGKSEIVHNFLDVLHDYKLKKDKFCELKDRTKLLTYYSGTVISKAAVYDVDRFSNFIDSIEEFSQTGENREMLENNIKSGSGRYYFIENEHGEIVSVAGTSAENKYAAMVISVATHKNYRNSGLASKCVSKLCIDVFQDCERICLFYDNPDAGKVYHSIGFEEIGNWSMAVER